MANGSVAIPSRSINPVSHLSHLIEAALQDSCDQPPDFHENFRRQFATLIRAIMLYIQKKALKNINLLGIAHFSG